VVQGTRRLQRPQAVQRGCARGSRRNQAVIGSGSPSIETLAPATAGGLGANVNPTGAGLVICTVQAQDQAPGGNHLPVSQVSETTRHNHFSPRHPATARRNRTTVSQQDRGKDERDPGRSGMRRPDPKYGMTGHLPQSAPPFARPTREDGEQPAGDNESSVPTCCNRDPVVPHATPEAG
jgi:hypothetical protein